MRPETRSQVFFSTARALWGEVFPEIRAVYCRILGDESFEIVCCVDGPVDPDWVEAFGCIETEVIADFPENFAISSAIERIDAPVRVLVPVQDGILIYKRKERSES